MVYIYEYVIKSCCVAPSSCTASYQYGKFEILVSGKGSSCSAKYGAVALVDILQQGAMAYFRDSMY